MTDIAPVLGFAPGGKHAFGVALVGANSVTFSTVSSVDEAIAWTTAICAHDAPFAAGIDTLLRWSCGPGGNRPAEKLLRVRYPDASPTVISPNSLYGSMVIGGMALGHRLRGIYPQIRLNETHPKLLARHFTGKMPKSAKGRLDTRRAWIESMLQQSSVSSANDHEVDAITSAWATRAAISKSAKSNCAWQDLFSDPDDAICPLPNVNYFWPR